MSFERLRYDTCSYEQRLKEATGPGVYRMNTPANDCDAVCSQSVPSDPYLRYQTFGPSTCPPGFAVDDHSELLGITRRASECPTQQHLRKEPLPAGRCGGAKQAPVRDCRPFTEPTRLSNPPCTLRGTGINRWQWLPENPQDHALARFEQNVQYRIVAKDNHRPCLYTPMDPAPLLPPKTAPGTVAGMGLPTASLCAVPPVAGVQGPGAGMLPSWRSCDAIRNM